MITFGQPPVPGPVAPGQAAPQPHGRHVRVVGPATPTVVPVPMVPPMVPMRTGANMQLPRFHRPPTQPQQFYPHIRGQGHVPVMVPPGLHELQIIHNSGLAARQRFRPRPGMSMPVPPAQHVTPTAMGSAVPPSAQHTPAACGMIDPAIVQRSGMIVFHDHIRRTLSPDAIVNAARRRNVVG